MMYFILQLLLVTGFLVPVLCLVPMEYPVYHSQPDEDGFARNHLLMEEVLLQISSELPPLESENCCSFVASLFTDYPLFQLESFDNNSRYINTGVVPVKISSESTDSASLPDNILLTLKNVSASISKFKTGASCRNISQSYSLPLPSAYYTLGNDGGSTFQVYCDMEGINCDGEAGWMRVAKVDITKLGSTCPEGLHQENISGTFYCGRSASSGECASTTFSVHNITYNQVCGRLKGFRYGTPSGYETYPYYTNLDDAEGWYVNGISISQGDPQNHIWTYATGFHTSQDYSDPTSTDCPCDVDADYTYFDIPAMIGEDYYCDPGKNNAVVDNVGPTGPLWIGKQCGGVQGHCCNPKMPWFFKTLYQPASNDIELRVCSDTGYLSEDTPLITEVELFVR